MLKSRQFFAVEGSPQAIFCVAGFLYRRSQSQEMSGNLGLGKFVPALMGFWGFFAFAGFAFPGT
ncbi:MAG: hypothetical protein K9N10_20775, partial [Deltaproteobacteria bacterium]|nr:hypothetical protein [Deltaproteobacteria bacterium]